MNWAEAVLAIVVVATLGKIARSYFASRHGVVVDDDGKAVAVPPREDPAENARLRGEITRLNERLAVLERLATDDNAAPARLDREIERLRERS